MSYIHCPTINSIRFRIHIFIHSKFNIQTSNRICNVDLNLFHSLHHSSFTYQLFKFVSWATFLIIFVDFSFIHLSIVITNSTVFVDLYGSAGPYQDIKKNKSFKKLFNSINAVVCMTMRIMDWLKENVKMDVKRLWHLNDD